MNYIQELRKVVGKRPLIMVGATVIVINPQNEILMMKRTDNRCWGVPGGAMEPGESIEVTASRETFEETRLTPGSLKLYKVFSGPELYYCYPDGAEVYNVSVVFISRDFEGTIDLDPSEHNEYGYFPLQNLPEPISPPIQPILKCFCDEFSK